MTGIWKNNFEAWNKKICESILIQESLAGIWDKKMSFNEFMELLVSIAYNFPLWIFYNLLEMWYRQRVLICVEK